MTKELIVKLQLSLLAFFMLIGFLFIGYSGNQNFQKMKHHLDRLYFGSHVKIVKLQALDSLYGSDLLVLVFRSKGGVIDPEEAVREIHRLKSNIQEKWGDYKGSYKSPEELDLLLSADRQIGDSLQRIDLIAEVLASKELARIKTLSYERILETIEKTRSLLGALIERENKNAYQTKESVNRDYEETLRVIWITLGGVFLLGSALAFFIGQSITLSHRLLHKQGQELKKANDALKELAIKDGLTGVYNRRFFDLIFERELGRASRERHAFTFIMIDIDHFKLYNDTYGHGEGDQVLKRVAKALDNTLERSSDYFFRLGGEEFCAFVMGLNEEQSLALCKKMLQAVERLKIPHKKNSASPYVTISMGAICLVPTPQSEAKKIIEKADGALYNAKGWGRNQAAILSHHEG